MASYQRAYWCFTQHGTHQELEQFVEKLKFLCDPSDMDKPILYFKCQEKKNEKDSIYRD